MQWAAVPARDLNIPLTLTSGQAFGWSPIEGGRWIGAISDTAVLLEPRADGFGWATWPAGRWSLIREYFALDVNLDALYSEWISRDNGFASLVVRFRGLRVLRQSAETTLCAFVCSSCNNVPRITRMLRTLTYMAGRRIPCPWAESVFAEPSFKEIGQIGETGLREAAFGYRARFLAELASEIEARGADYLAGLKSVDWDHARKALTALPGVGGKVADCVGLFGLAHDDVVPVDRHVRRYVISRLRPDLATKSLTPCVYSALASAFRGIMGPYAGWAQQYVFMAARSGRQSVSDLEVEP